jgi:hypothetical protein
MTLKQHVSNSPRRRGEEANHSGQHLNPLRFILASKLRHP